MRLYPSDIAIPAVSAALIALLWSQWEPLPPRLPPHGLFAESGTWALEEETSLRSISETAKPRDWAVVAARLADVYGMQERHEEEADLLERCLRIRDKYIAERKQGLNVRQDSVTAKMVAELADVYAGLGQAAKALPLQQRALEYAVNNNEPTANILAGISTSQRGLGMDSEALATLFAALKIKFPKPKEKWTPDAVARDWLKQYRDLLVKTGKTAEEVSRIMRDEFGQ